MGPRGEPNAVLVNRQARRWVRVVALVSGLAVSAALLVNPATTAADPAPPPNPSDGQIHNAQQAKDNLANQIGQLSGQIAALQSQIRMLNGNAELAEQRLALAVQQLQEAQAAAAKAKQQVQAAQNAVVAARSRFDQFARDSYMQGTVDGLTGGLLTATDPNALLQRGDLLQYAASNKIDVIGDLSRATIARSNADAAARLAEQKKAAATAAAAKARQDAVNALNTAKAENGQLQSQLASKQTSLDAAKEQLATLNGQRAKYVAWQKYMAYLAWKREQERIAAARAAAAAAARAAAARAAAAQAAAARAAAEQAAAEQAAQNSGSGGSGGGGGSNGGSGGSGGSGGGGGGGGGGDGGTVLQPVAAAPAPPATGWTPAAGQAAVNRAMQYLGWPYAWAGGNASGPTYGVCGPDGAFNDCNVYGFDCSGLAMYAWGIDWVHFAATQYTQAGSLHPSTDQLMPGDLVFWSDDGTISGIGHVAIYIGNGNVIQAPYSGAQIEITPLDQVEDGYFGATRPLT